jgi:adenine-specific DNA-methyltransferase
MLEDNSGLRGFARRMRTEPTTAEQRLWRLLRNRRLVGLKFRRQHPFGPYILDCYCPAARLVVELDGDTHADAETQKRDAERTAYLERRGLKVLRFWNGELAENEEGVVTRIVEECAQRTNLPTEATLGDSAEHGLPEGLRPARHESHNDRA